MTNFLGDQEQNAVLLLSPLHLFEHSAEGGDAIILDAH